MVDRSVRVRLQADIAQFEQAMGRAASATGQVGEEGKRSGSVLTSALSSGVQTVANLTGAATVAATGLGAAVWSVGSNYNALEQQSRAAMTTILGSEAAANRMMDQVAEFGQSSPFPRQAFIEGTQQLLAFGMEADRVVPTLAAIQDGVAAAGGSSTEITEIIRVLAQVQSTGTITAETLNQLGTRGIDAAKLIGQGFDMTGAQVRESITDGTIDAREALTVLTDQMTATYGGAAENVKETWLGARDSIAASFRDVSSDIIEPFVTRAGGGYALDWVNGFAGALRATRPIVQEFVGVIDGRFGPAADRITDSLQSAQETIEGFDAARLVAQLDGVSQYAPLIAGVTGALVGMSTRAVPVLGSLGLAISPVTAGLGALIAASPELRGVLGDFLSDLQPLVPVLGGVAGGLLDAGTQILQALVPGLSALLDALAPVILDLGEGFGGAAVVAAQALVPVAEVTGDLLSVVSQIPTPLVNAAAGLGAIKLATSGLGLATVATSMRNLGTNAALTVGGLRDSQRLLGTTATAAGALSATAGRAAGALRGIWTAIGGPFGAAIMAGVGLLTAWSSSQREAREHTDALRDSLDEQTGAFTQNTEEYVRQQLLQDGHLAYYKQAGGDVRDLTAAILGDADARARVNALLEDQTYWQDTATGGSSRQESEARKLGNTLDDLAGYTAAAVEEDRLYAESALDTADAMSLSAEQMERITGLAGGVADGVALYVDQAILAGEAGYDMAAGSDEAAEALERQREALSDTIGQFVDFGDAARVAQDMSRERAETLADEANATVDWADETERNTGRVKASWEDFYDGDTIDPENYLQALRDMQEAEERWADNLVSLAGRIPDEAIAELAALGPEHAQLIDSIANDFTEPQLREFADLHGRYGDQAGQQFQDNLAATLTDPAFARTLALGDLLLADGVNEAMRERIARGEITVQQALDQYGLDVDVDVDTDPAELAYMGWVDEMGNHHPTPGIQLSTVQAEGTAAAFILNTSRTPAIMPMDANNALAMGVLDHTLLTIARSTEDVIIDGDDGRGQGVLADLMLTIRRSAEDVTIDGDPTEARGVLADTLGRIRESTGTLDIDADPADADREMGWFFSRWSDRTIDVKASVGAAVSSAFSFIGNADGGLYAGGVKAYAAGGIDDAGHTVPRQSMMAGPQFGRTNILWGEPETGWEAYISGKPGMEGRNRRILSMAAERLGMSIVGHANGAMRGMPTTVNLGATIDDRAIGAGIATQVGRAVSAAIREQGVAGNGGPSGGSWRTLWAQIRSMFPNAIMTSNYRPGARTLSGYPSRHGRGLAVDWVTPNMARDAARLHAFMGRNLAEHYFSPWGFSRNGSMVPRSRMHPATIRTHYDHIHSAFGNGGIIDALSRPQVADTGKLVLRKGWNATYNGTGRDEHLAERWASADRAAYMQSVTPGVPGGGVTATLDARSTALLEKVAAVADRPIQVQSDVVLDRRQQRDIYANGQAENRRNPRAGVRA